MTKLIENIISMMRFKSVSGNEKEIRLLLDWVKKQYLLPGIFINEFNFDNASPVLILANCSGFDFDLATIGHLDVVPAEDELFLPRIEGNRLYGRGSLDMKSTVAVCLETLEYTIGKNIRFGVIITTDEETTSNGMKALQNKNFISAVAVLDTDSGSMDELVEKYKHPVSVELRAEGLNAHSSRPWEGINAVNRIIDALKELEKYFPCYQKNNLQPDNQWVDTMAITAVSSPSTYNVVPNKASARLNFRLTEKMPLEKLEDILATVCKLCDCEYEILLKSRGVYMDCNTPQIKKYLETAQSVTGHKINITTSCGATDSRMFADSSAVIMHSVNGENAHGNQEYVEISSISDLSKIQKAYVDEIIKEKA
ncbi:MAG: M20 family metallopeptidase [Alphaproteobacteria bacterium]|nr:M20 family metallopeptidase [Alphaproteobacteria bacterium]